MIRRRRYGTRRWPYGALLVAGLLVAACAPAPEGLEFPPSREDGGSDAPSAAVEECPAEAVPPAQDRPLISLQFSLAENLRIVTGTEQVRFTPDLPTDELVFRLIPNSPLSAPFGNLLTITDVSGEQVSDYGYESADAYPTTPGGLLVVELEDEVAAGDSVEVLLNFELELGDGTFDRFGTADGLSWWGSGYPLLSWEPGVGWSRDQLVTLSGETSTSQAADTTISVEAPEDLEVLMTGDQDRPEPAGDGRRIWTSTEAAARDVSVAAGQFDTADAAAGDTEITVGVLPDADADAAELAQDAASIIEEFEEFFGPFPYDTLSIPVLPDFGGGIEYPSSILLATSQRFILVHEIAHMWFYGMIGNSQFRDPWLDEAFASYAEVLVDASAPDSTDLRTPGDIGGSMADFPDTDEYFSVVYGKGRAALVTAREAAGPAAFDAGLRCYINSQAWQIAVPGDVAVAFADLPEALRILEEAGAFR
ncbi:MAG: peptidase M1 [Geodermatophilaceae bacterium]|nr:peptidase M1 [Geodermatophilaceae bacterium]